MHTIYKYPLAIAEQHKIEIPNGFRIAHVGLDPHGTPCIWAIVNPERKTFIETFHVYGTGHPIPDEVAGRNIGSFVQGPFVWHVFHST